MAKISSFIIMMVAFSLVLVAGIVPILDIGDEQYGIDDYNSSSLGKYNKITEIREDTEELKDKSIDLQSKSGNFDVLGGFFESAYDGLKIGFRSIGSFISQITSFMQDLVLANKEVFLAAIVSIVILIVVFIILRAVIKDQL